MFSLTRREFDAVSAELTQAWTEAVRRDRLAMFRNHLKPATLQPEPRRPEPSLRDRRPEPRH